MQTTSLNRNACFYPLMATCLLLPAPHSSPPTPKNCFVLTSYFFSSFWICFFIFNLLHCWPDFKYNFILSPFMFCLEKKKTSFYNNLLKNRKTSLEDVYFFHEISLFWGKGLRHGCHGDHPSLCQMFTTPRTWSLEPILCLPWCISLDICHCAKRR